MAREVVHHDDVAGPQLGDEDPLDIGFERVAVDRLARTKGATITVRLKPATKVVVSSDGVDAPRRHRRAKVVVF
jgi:hypothetical protein